MISGGCGPHLAGEESQTFLCPFGFPSAIATTAAFGFLYQHCLHPIAIDGVADFLKFRADV